MILLYILLVIIAIGVLLISKEGRQLLNSLFWVGLICSAIYLAFWAVIITIGLFSNKGIRDTILTIAGGVMIVSYAIYGIYNAYKGFKTGNYSIRSILARYKKQIYGRVE
jgi:hypothetical protein